MRAKLYLMLLLVGAFALSTPTLTAQKGKGNGTVEPYSITAKALRGPADTEVTVSLATSKPATSPIPAVLKKLQLKIRNAAGDVVFIKNLQNLPVAGDKVVVSVPEPAQHAKLEVLAQIKTTTTVDAEMLKTNCVVQLRPDLTISTVNFPAEHTINVPFEVEVVVNELNLETGATASVTLLEGTSTIGTVSGVNVAAGGQVSVVFGALTVSTVGTKNYTAQISSVVPGDYNTNNNSFDFSINFVDPTPVVNQSYYGLYYYNYNYLYSYKYTRLSDGLVINHYHNEYQDESFQYYTYLYSGTPQTMGAPVSADYKVEATNLSPVTGSVTNLAPYYYDGYSAYYNFYDAGNNISFWAYTDVNGYYQSQIYRYQSRYVYYYNDYSGYNYYYSYQYGSGAFFDAATEIKASMVTTIGNFTWGGGATMPIYSYYNYGYSYDYNYWDDYWGSDINYQYNYHYTYTYNNSWGVTDPTMLPKAGVLQNPVLTDQVFGLEKVYQNGSNATVQFSLAEEAPYVLNVTDMQGRTALRVVEGKQAAGMQIKQLDVSKLNPGIYVFTLRSGNQTETKKVILN